MSKLLVRDLMTEKVVALRPEDSLARVQEAMDALVVRHLPVVDSKGLLVGLVSNRDLLAASLSRALRFEAKQRRAFLRSVAVEEVMSSDLTSIGPGTTLQEAASLLIERRIG